MGIFKSRGGVDKFNCDGVGAIFQVLQSDTGSIFGGDAPGLSSSSLCQGQPPPTPPGILTIFDRLL